MSSNASCILVVTSMHHGNTMKVAEAMSAATGIQVYAPGDEARALIEQGAVPCLGSGIFFGQHHQSLLKFVDGLATTAGRDAFVFSTSGSGLGPAGLLGRRCHRPLARLLADKGFEVAGEFGCKGFDTYGPWGKLGGVARGRPNAEELQQAREFAIRMQAIARNNRA